jgi:hypothetical protein
VLLCITENMNPNHNVIPCFVEKNPKQHLKFVLYQNIVSGFLLQVPPTPPPLLSPLLNHPKSLHHDPNNNNSKFKLTKFLD